MEVSDYPNNVKIDNDILWRVQCANLPKIVLDETLELDVYVKRKTLTNITNALKIVKNLYEQKPLKICIRNTPSSIIYSH